MTKRAKIEERETKELMSLRKKEAKPLYKGYLIVIMVVAILTHVVDEITTLVGNNVKSSMVTEFFVEGMGLSFNDGLSYLSALGMAGLVVSLLVPFYKSLADKYGRKIFLVVNTLGMGVSMLICLLAKSFWLYFAGQMLGTFFIAHDIQVIYILETAPADKRTRYYGLTKAIGTLGFVLVPLMRRYFMDNDPTQWRMVYLVPILMTVVIAAFALVLAKESRPFLKQRIEYLEIPYEERIAKAKEEKAQKKANKNKTGVFAAIKYIFKDKQLRWVTIVYLIYYLCMMGMTQYYEPIMYAANMTTESITDALFMYGFMFALVILIAGFLGDALGRKATVIICGSLSIVLFILFVFGANNGWNPYLVGTFYGLYLGCFWQGGDYLMIIASEKTPTSNRTSVLSAMGFLMMFIGLLGTIYMSVALQFTSISLAVLILAVPCIVISLLILAFKVKDTKGVDLTKIGEEGV